MSGQQAQEPEVGDWQTERLGTFQNFFKYYFVGLPGMLLIIKDRISDHETYRNVYENKQVMLILTWNVAR